MVTSTCASRPHTHTELYGLSRLQRRAAGLERVQAIGLRVSVFRAEGLWVAWFLGSKCWVKVDIGARYFKRGCKVSHSATTSKTH